jgi:hypothetical protein
MSQAERELQEEDEQTIEQRRAVSGIMPLPAATGPFDHHTRLPLSRHNMEVGGTPIFEAVPVSAALQSARFAAEISVAGI